MRRQKYPFPPLNTRFSGIVSGLVVNFYWICYENDFLRPDIWTEKDNLAYNTPQLSTSIVSKQRQTTIYSKLIHTCFESDPQCSVDARQLLLGIFSHEWFTMNTDETRDAGNYRKVIKHRFSDGTSAVLNHLYCCLPSTTGMRDWAAACGHVWAQFQPTHSPDIRILDEICCVGFLC